MKRRICVGLVGVMALATISVAGLGHAADLSNTQSRLRSEMIGNLEFMRNAFHTQYAPADWKKTFTQWDLDEQINHAQEFVQQSQSPVSIRDYQNTLRKLFLSTRDYHTSISFLSTESATLPFIVKGAEGRYFIVYIDRTKLSVDSFPFQEGDELVRFGDQSADEAVKALLANTIINSQQTDQELSELDLTNRRAARGLAVPQGPITIAVRPKGSDTVFTRQLIWSYNPEKISSSLFQALSNSQRLTSGARPFLKRTMLGGNFDVSEGASRVENPYSVGARKTFTPDLGKKIWQSNESDPFYAYIFQNTDKKLIGYIRIPSYVASMYTTDYVAAVDHFRKLVTLFQSTTDGLVIDQVNNPGGSVSYLYSLVSMLSDQAVKTPRHRMKITQSDVMSAIQGLEKIAQIKNDADAQKILGDVLDGYPATYQIAQFYKGYYEFIINEFKAGHQLTAPYWIEGVDQINPAADHFTKPILLLINGLDFSGGDFFPAILQDNKRVKIFGTRTAGAGGYVLDFTYPNLFGIDKFRLTGSIAERVDLNPIENLGVKPDVEYSMSADDLQNQYRGYIQAIQKTMSEMTR
jgi:hypothetical protein